MATRGNRACGIASVVLAVLNGFGLLGLAAALVFERPKFAAIYADLGIELPLPTRVVLAVPNGAVVLGALALLGLLAGKEWIVRKEVPLVLNIAWAAAGVSLSLLACWALMAPVAATVQEM